MALIINGERIEEEAITNEMQRIGQAQKEQLGLSESETADKLRERAKDNIIDHVVLSQETKENGPEVTDKEVEDELSRTCAMYGGQEQFLQRHGMTEDNLPWIRSHIRQSMQSRKLMDANCSPEEPTEEDLNTYFQNYAEKYKQPEQVAVSHIVKRTEGKGKDAVYQTLIEARNKILDGMDFGEAADQYSECTDTPQGDLGYFAPGKMVESFETVVFSMREGEISPVFSTEFGYHVAKVTGWQEPRYAELSEVRDQVENDLRKERYSKAQADYLASLREKAEIKEVNDEKNEQQSDKANQDNKSSSKSGKKKNK